MASRAVIGLLAAPGLFVLGCGADVSAGSTPVPRRDTPRVGRLLAAPEAPGDPSEGRRLFVSTGCAGCHTVRTVPAATGVSGPNLTNVVLRPTLAGETVPMTPGTLVGFLLEPSTVKPGTAMPDVGLTAEEAQHITAFLSSQPYNPPR